MLNPIGLMPEILYRIEIREFGKPGQRPDAILELPSGDKYGTTEWLIVILNTELMLEQLL